jgi:hypothetical protein
VSARAGNPEGTEAPAEPTRPLCRLVCTLVGAEREWTWEACDEAVSSRIRFTSLYPCAEDARQNGFEVDLLCAPLVAASNPIQ